jgi:hypothetical protein
VARVVLRPVSTAISSKLIDGRPGAATRGRRSARIRAVLAEAGVQLAGRHRSSGAARGSRALAAQRALVVLSAVAMRAS